MFITFEGGEGSGKSYQMKQFHGYLKDKGHDVYSTRDPGDTIVGNQIRRLVVAKKYKSMSPETELLLYLAARAELVTKNIIPNLNKGKIVLCDRFFDSTYIYQGILRGWNGQEYNNKPILEIMHYFFSNQVVPSYTVLLDVTARVGLRRSNDKLAGMDMDESKWEDMGLDIHTRINREFRALARQNKDRFIVVDADSSKGFVTAELIDSLRRRIGNFNG